MTNDATHSRRDLLPILALLAASGAAATGATAAEAADAPHDWAFLVGRWSARHRRLKQRLVGSSDWEIFGGTLVNWPLMGGLGNVGDNLIALPAGTYRGVGFRAWDPQTRQWSSWWLDGRDPATITTPVRGAFSGGIGTFIADDTFQDRPIKVRVLWSGITANSARWEQASSADGGATWEVNWTTDFTRQAG